MLGNATEGSSEPTTEESNFQTQNASNNQTSIDSRTKGVCSAPHTHSGPTGPPQIDKDNPAQENTQEGDDAHNKQTITITCSSSRQPQPPPQQTTSDNTSSHSSVSSSSCSNKATIQRQKRLRTPVWARSMSTNKTYINFFS